MKALIGIDSRGDYRPGLDLFARLNLPNPEVLLCSVVNAAVPYAGFGLDAEALQAEYTTMLHNQGLRALDDARDEACARGIKAKTSLVFGPVVPSLLHEIDLFHADLAVVNGTPKGFWANAFVGSVARGLANSCPTSLLISKNAKFHDGLTAVFATDHSPYCNAAFERFLAMQTRGIRRVHVVSAYQVEDAEALLFVRSVPDLATDMRSWVKDRLTEKNELLAQRLRDAGFEASHSVANGPTNDVLRQTMREREADLLVLGAQGHGFFERLILGSVAAHQVGAEPYPVLLLRNPAK